MSLLTAFFLDPGALAWIQAKAPGDCKPHFEQPENFTQKTTKATEAIKDKPTNSSNNKHPQQPQPYHYTENDNNTLMSSTCLALVFFNHFILDWEKLLLILVSESLPLAG